MKIAIIGSGISGLTCGYYLHQQHDITLFEANDYIGGHTATIDVQVDGEDYAVDTGFIVYNDRTYPNFMRLLDEIGVSGKATEMSFSVRNDSNGLEYNGHSLSTLFAQRSNWFRPGFYRFIAEIVRFNKLAKRSASMEMSDSVTLGEFLHVNGFSDYFCQNYILPMGAAIWSSTLADIRAFPLKFFTRFFLNHGLLDISNRPQWYVINGGSRAYIDPLTQGFSDRIRLNSPVEGVWRHTDRVVVSANGVEHEFDQVIFACHSDQALKMLRDPTLDEIKLLSAMHYQANEVVLHLDTELLPRRKAAHASWNYLIEQGDDGETRLPCLTYNMNILQHIQSDHTFCVSLNASGRIDPDKVLRTFTYHHPLFNRASLQAQQNREFIQGRQHSWFCGAYWHNGFHEDGVRSALDVVAGLSALQEQPVHKGAA